MARSRRPDIRYQQAPPTDRRVFYYHHVPRDHVSKCVKYALFSFNFIFWLIGLLIVCAGIWISIDLKNKQVRDHLDIFLDPALVLAIIGLLMFIIGFFGCLGALRENICLLKCFHICLILLMLCEVALGVLVCVFYFMPSVRQHLGAVSPQKSLQHAIVRYRDDDDLRDLIDVMQRKFECCGVRNNNEGFRDWQANIYFNCSEENPSVERCGVPHSCCRIEEGTMINVMCGFDTTNKEVSEVQNEIYTQGCVQGFGLWLERNAILVGAGCLVALIPQMLGICFARTLIDQVEMQRAQWR